MASILKSKLLSEHGHNVRKHIPYSTLFELCNQQHRLLYLRFFFVELRTCAVSMKVGSKYRNRSRWSTLQSAENV
uniref:Uncharacterized protein n=1 Tax=Physcomitrium patens TaxID=3218 RepID=A0A2K1K8N1_PHYPA|nr:hypothetical protein PHYPA_012030 [Physcomitrium patens]